ncbi:MAG: hypothetical protein ACOCP4_07095 [Candidatus Woesearchaeota archaeon]
MHIYFLHISKTAGTSLDILVKLQYSKKEIHPWDNGKFHDLQKKYSQNILEPQEFKILKGHFFYGIHRYLSNSDDYKYITFLRYPVERVKSHIRQFLRMSNSLIFNEYKMERSLYNLLKKHKYSFSNLQTS